MIAATTAALIALSVIAMWTLAQGGLYLRDLRRALEEDRKAYKLAQTAEDDILGIQAPQPESYDVF